MYIRSLKIQSLRCFDNVELDFQYPGRKGFEVLKAPNVNLLLGNNGAGKTTILRAAALATLAPVLPRSSGYRSNHMIRHGEASGIAEAEVELHPQDLGNVSIGSLQQQDQVLVSTTSKEGDEEYLESMSTVPHLKEMFNQRSPGFLIVGYGASRRVQDSAAFSSSEQSKLRHFRYQRVAGLFEPYLPLTPLTTWLPQLKKTNRAQYTKVVQLIDKLLPENDNFDGSQEKEPYGEYLFQINGESTPFSAVSDGYRAYIGWVADLLSHISAGAVKNANLTDYRGVVLVDEIDSHLHPEWQRTVISTVSTNLPNLQFIFSTHSPIVAGSLEKENIFVMETQSGGKSRVVQYTERIYGMDAQQVLLSPYFGLETTRAPGFVDEVQQLSKQLKPGHPEIALQMMRKMTGDAEPAPTRARRITRAQFLARKVRKGLALAAGKAAAAKPAAKKKTRRRK